MQIGTDARITHHDAWVDHACSAHGDARRCATLAQPETGTKYLVARDVQ
jgi:hypothetical protein